MQAGAPDQTVVPALSIDVKFAVLGGKTVLVVLVPKGAEPLYYVDNVAYVRDGSMKRPATPGEIVTRVKQSP